ncbi:hypothetical protein KCTC32516_00528 [Polaribacter huanghezhanensis]|uniref:hypothetical protein n=1 Tax=Polaribacter huanghezhanensis TaxID=1354726 RepID=UPI002649ED6C|nr:hypothetical protein [Polaribacter huanghezhanensis]WKD85188.1 hypothetical protein KCTC32516_00528 [Polaribacter huanghezhanensis]
MKIAILGWGSLIWNPEILKFDKQNGWNEEGPILPIEFSRISRNGRITLVISKNGSMVQTLYSNSSESKLDNAIANLRKREGTNLKNIGYYSKDSDEFFPKDFEFKQNILDWICKKEIDAVIWTDLNENWKDITEDRIEYLRSLKDETKELAKEYIIKTPEQIKTVLRERIKKELNWK